MSARMWTEEQFNCPVCLDLPSDPTTIPCGHSYCMACITDHWDTEERKTGTYSCPECRQNFSPRPMLCRNTMLAEAVEQLRGGALSSAGRESIKTARRAAADAAARGGSRKLSSPAVTCDRCADTPRAAVKTCLTCMASFCESHLKQHQSKAKLKGHELIGPTADLALKMCAQHKYLQEFYCRQCQLFICWLCTSNEHKGHESVSTQAERNERQKELADVQSENHQRLLDRERELKDMKKVLESLKRSSDTVSTDAETVLSELQRSVERTLDLLQDVLLSTGQEKLDEAQAVVRKLEAEVKQLKRKDRELKQVVKCQDNIQFLQTYKTLCTLVEASDLGSVTVNHEATFDPVRSAIHELRDRVEEMCNQELGKINKTVYSTTVFTVADNRAGQKTGILKLFSGKGSKSSNTPVSGPPALPSVSVRGPGPASHTPNVRNREEPRVDRQMTSSPRPGERQPREEREQADNRSSQSSLRPQERQRREPEREPEREVQSPPRPQERQNRQTNESEASNRSSLRPTERQRTGEHEQADTWSLSSLRPRDRQRREEREQANGESQSSPRPTPVDRKQAERQSDRWSLSSLLPKNRRKKQESVRQATPISEVTTPLNTGLGNPFLDNSPTEVNPGLFLDTPTSAQMTNPAFPMLREIDLDSIQAPEPRTREEFLQYACLLTLDPNTAHRRLLLSEGNAIATLQQSAQPYPDLPQRFDGWTQVMCLQPLPSDRCYWEVEWRGSGSSLGVAHGAMQRKGADGRAGLGYNGQSWSLELSDTCCTAMHNNQKRDIPVTYSPRVGLYLDRPAGTLTFYSVDDPLTPLHTFQGSFPQPLFAAFGVGSVGLNFAMGQLSSSTDSIKICEL